MKLKKIGAFYLFKDRTGVPLRRGDKLILSFPTGGCLILNGTHAYRSENGAFAIPLHLFREGTNTLSFEAEGKCTPVEKLRKLEDCLIPAGLLDEALLLSLLEEAEALALRVDALEDELSYLKNQNNQRVLFS